MMLLFKIFQFFLLPSTIISILILIGLILSLKPKKRKIGRILLIIGIILYYIFSITPTGDLILLPLENQYQPLQRNEFDKADKIVLLSGGESADVLRASEVLRIYVQKCQTPNVSAGKCQIIISGTYPLNPNIDEAGEVKRFLVERGIPSENIILENKSRNTFENAKNIKELVDSEPFFLVTSSSHMPRAMKIFQKMGTNPIPAAAYFKIKRDYNFLDFLPNLTNLERLNLAFHEYFGISLPKILIYD